ncbi:MAG: hypothetical protein FWD54_04460 [Endomicrobia bacterium]|nr:hypothetical protein [Endomicrobiia bacterium]
MKLDFISHTLNYKYQPTSATKTIENIYRLIPNKIAYKELKDEYQTALNMAKALEYNADFEKFILWFRKNKGLFEQPILNEYDLKRSTLISPPDLVKQINSSAFGIRISRATINEKYVVHKELFKQIPFISYYNAIFLPLIQPDIKITTDTETDKIVIKDKNIPDEENYNTVNIQISSNITAGAVIDFLKKRSNLVKSKTEMIKRDNFKISKKHLEIVRLRQEGKKFEYIAEAMSDKYYNGSADSLVYTKENVFKAYQRANYIFSVRAKKGTKS